MSKNIQSLNPDDFKSIYKDVPSEYKKKCIVTDLDGTIALLKDRGYYDDYKYDTDDLDQKVLNIILGTMKFYSDVFNEYVSLIVITGRMATPKGIETTTKWVEKNTPALQIKMRNMGDYRKDYDVKSELIKEVKKEYHILAAFDDRESSCKAFRDNGIMCLQVREDNSEPKKCKMCDESKDNNYNYCPYCGRNCNKYE